MTLDLCQVKRPNLVYNILHMEYIEIIKNILITHSLSQDKLAKILELIKQL